MERLDLHTYADERGPTRYDLPDADLSDVDTAADRTRLMSLFSGGLLTDRVVL